MDADLFDRLLEARLAGDYCPVWLPGTLTLEEALAVQLQLLERELARGEQLAGWKVGLTSERARSSLGADVRPFGYLLASGIFASGATIAASSVHGPSIEPELCFRFRAPLSGRVTREEVAEAVERVSAGFELNERRPGSARTDLPAMVADRLTQWGIVEGDGLPLSEVADLGSVRCELLCNGETVYVGLSRDELDDHLESLRRLVLGLAEHGRGIEAGQRAITGAFARREVAPGQRWLARYEPLGTVEISFT